MTRCANLASIFNTVYIHPSRFQKPGVLVKNHLVIKGALHIHTHCTYTQFLKCCPLDGAMLQTELAAAGVEQMKNMTVKIFISFVF